MFYRVSQVMGVVLLENDFNCERFHCTCNQLDGAVKYHILGNVYSNVIDNGEPIYHSSHITAVVIAGCVVLQAKASKPQS